jgi:hypothetical protein
VGQPLEPPPPSCSAPASFTVQAIAPNPRGSAAHGIACDDVEQGAVTAFYTKRKARVLAFYGGPFQNSYHFLFLYLSASFLALA